MWQFQQRSVQHYEQAADYFRGEESTSSANKCMLKVAQYAAQLEDYQKAIEIYEQVSISDHQWWCMRFVYIDRVCRLSKAQLSVVRTLLLIQTLI